MGNNEKEEPREIVRYSENNRRRSDTVKTSYDRD